MSLFHRRSIQEMLNDCSSFLSDAQLKKMVKSLNSEREESLVTQWELAVLFGLNQIGKVVHEQRIGGSEPDVRWRSNTFLDHFVGDVRTVSDKGLEKDNPREFYRLELRRLVKKRGFDPNHFADWPEGKVEGSRDKRKMRLLYPNIGASQKLFGSDFEKFLSDIKEYQLAKHAVRIVGENINVVISYDQNVKSSGGGNPSYKVYYSPLRNPIFTALQDKARQLRKTNYEGPRIIFLADGGCEGLSRDHFDYTGRTYSDDQVIERFLRGSSSITGVITLSVDQPIRYLLGRTPRQFRGKIFLNPKAKHRLSDRCVAQLSMLPAHWKPPKLDPWNALNHLRNGWDGPHKGWYSGCSVTGGDGMTEIKLSARALAEYLAGRLTRDEFARKCGERSVADNLFELFLSRGEVIQSVAFDQKPNQDDDQIILRYSVDPAASPFREPEQLFLKLLWKKLRHRKDHRS